MNKIGDGRVFSLVHLTWNDPVGKLWIDTDRIKPKYMEKNLSKFYFAHDESHMNRSVIEIQIFAVGGA
jgi:hypothetical protein